MSNQLGSQMVYMFPLMLTGSYIRRRPFPELLMQGLAIRSTEDHVPQLQVRSSGGSPRDMVGEVLKQIKGV